MDESVDRVPLDYPADLVGISVLTGTARRAYALADHFRSRGIPVVLGGVHVTILPDEAARYADAIVVGMAEKTWPQLLRDFKAGKMAPVYRDESPPGRLPRGRPDAPLRSAAQQRLHDALRGAGHARAASTPAISARCRSCGSGSCGGRSPT